MSRKKKKLDIDWRSIINGLPGPFPEVGDDPPDMEMIPEEEPPNKFNLKMDTVGEYSKLIVEIHFFNVPETGKKYTMQNHLMEDYGELTLKEVLQSIKK